MASVLPEVEGAEGRGGGGPFGVTDEGDGRGGGDDGGNDSGDGGDAHNAAVQLLRRESRRSGLAQ